MNTDGLFGDTRNVNHRVPPVTADVIGPNLHNLISRFDRKHIPIGASMAQVYGLAASFGDFFSFNNHPSSSLEYWLENIRNRSKPPSQSEVAEIQSPTLSQCQEIVTKKIHTLIYAVLESASKPETEIQKPEPEPLRPALFGLSNRDVVQTPQTQDRKPELSASARKRLNKLLKASADPQGPSISTS